MNYQGSTCICRVPKAQLRAGTIVECVHCGMFYILNAVNRSLINVTQVVADVAPIRDMVLAWSPDDAKYAVFVTNACDPPSSCIVGIMP